MPPLAFNQDAVQYLSLAEHLSRGEGYRSALHYFDDFMQPPLYPLLIAATMRLGVEPLHAAILVCTLASVLTLLALVGIQRELWGARGLVISAGIGATYANLAVAANLTLEPLFLCLISSAVYFALRGLKRERVSETALAGALLGLSILARSEAVVSFAAAILLIARTTSSLKRFACHATTLASAAAVFLVPYGFWMFEKLGYVEVLPKIRYNLPVPSITENLDFSELGAESVEVERVERTLLALMPDNKTFVLNYAFKHPEFDPRGMFPKRPEAPTLRGKVLAVVPGLRAVLSDSLHGAGALNPMASLLILLGVRRASKKASVKPDESSARIRARMVYWMAFAGLLNLAPALASGADFQSRYMAAVLLFSVPLVSGGALSVSDALRARARLAGSTPTLLVVMILGAVNLFFTLGLARRNGGGAAQWVRSDAIFHAVSEHVPRGASILTNCNRYAWLRGGVAVQLPYVATLSELTHYIRQHGSEYLVVDSRLLRTSPSPVLRETLTNPNAWPEEWSIEEALFPERDPAWIVRLRR